MSDWLLVGSSPSAPEFVEAINGIDWPHTSMTTNAGIKLLPNADYYLALDQHAVEMFADDIRAAQKQGTQIVVLEDYEAKMRKAGGLASVDVVLAHMPPPTVDGRKLLRIHDDTIVNVWMSGPVLPQFAVKWGATRMILVGFEGYRSHGEALVIDHFDGRTGDGMSATITEEKQARLFRELAAYKPLVKWTFGGDMTYSVDAPNVTICETPSELARVITGGQDARYAENRIYKHVGGFVGRGPLCGNVYPCGPEG